MTWYDRGDRVWSCMIGMIAFWLYDNSDQRRIRTENQIRTKDKFVPNFEIRPKLFR